MIFKIIIFFIVIYIIYAFIKRKLYIPKNQEDIYQKDITSTVQCSYCKVYVIISDKIFFNNKNYCSKECLQSDLDKSK